MKLIKSLLAVAILLTCAKAHALIPCEIKHYATAALLTAATPKDCTIAYADDSDVYYVRAAGSWTALSTLTQIAGSNGGTIANGTNNMWDISENSETLRLNLGTSNSLTMSSATGVDDLTTDFDFVLSGGVGVLTLSDTASSMVIPNNDASALDIGGSGLTNLLRFDTSTSLQKLIVTGTTTATAFHVDVGLALFDELVSIGGGAGAITLTNSAASALTIDNDTSAFDFGSSGLTTALRYSSEDNKEVFTFGAGVANTTHAMAGGNVTLDASDCGKVLTSIATDDTFTWTLPATINGCIFTFSYIGAAAGALVDISPNASDGVYGMTSMAPTIANSANAVCSTTCAANACLYGLNTGALGNFLPCSDATSDTCICAPAALSGTDDADIGITKATVKKGDYIRIIGDGVDGWYIIGNAGVIANN